MKLEIPIFKSLYREIDSCDSSMCRRDTGYWNPENIWKWSHDTWCSENRQRVQNFTVKCSWYMKSQFSRVYKEKWSHDTWYTQNRHGVQNSALKSPWYLKFKFSREYTGMRGHEAWCLQNKQGSKFWLKISHDTWNSNFQESI